MRAALGAGRTRLLRQLLTEALVLFVLGALGGFVIALITTTALERLPLPQNVPVSLELSPDLRVLAFALGVSLLTGLIFGLSPALQGARKDITGRLRDGLPSTGGNIFPKQSVVSPAMIDPPMPSMVSWSKPAGMACMAS